MHVYSPTWLLPISLMISGGLTIIDDTDLKILLNKCLARRLFLLTNLKGLDFQKYDSDSDYVMIEKHQIRVVAKSKLSWVKLIGGILVP